MTFIELHLYQITPFLVENEDVSAVLKIVALKMAHTVILDFSTLSMVLKTSPAILLPTKAIVGSPFAILMALFTYTQPSNIILSHILNALAKRQPLLGTLKKIVKNLKKS